MKTIHKTIGLAVFAAAGYASLVLAAEPYRESASDATAMPPSVEKDHTNTYPYWKDRANLPALGGKDEWKLNWKFRDRPLNDQLHGGDEALDRGEALYKTLNANGSFAACLGAPDGNLKGLRLKYPMYSDSFRQVVGLEAMIEHCAAKAGAKLMNGSYDNSAVSVYVASFSNGMPIHIEVSQGPLKESFERGRRAFNLKAGRNNLAWASCHVDMVGNNLRGQTPTTMYGDAAHWPTWRGKDELQSLHVRLTECDRNAGVQPLKIGSQTYTDIEVYLTALSNGYPYMVPSMRD
jgi:sulfur-oxidizing protein SoxA